MTTKDDIRRWLDRGKKQGATHMVVVCDTYDYEDYPVFVNSPADAEKAFEAPGEMQRGMEIYNLGMDLELQIAMRRCYQL